MALSSFQITLLCAIGIVLLAKPAHAFGAGNIGSTSKVEGQNWRHGDLEDTLLSIVAARAMGGKKFSKLDVKRVYFGNWLRDYSQAVDVGTVKHVSAEAIRILLWILGFMSFGYGSGEFEVTTQRLGCYRPEEHIDNPKDYADNEDARRYDKRLRGPVDERRELSIDPQTGLKNYIATEGIGIDTSAGLVRKLFGRSIQLGRQYARGKDKKDLYEALRLLGTASHCLEDYAAHSNYVELALIELGERDVFPHVGRRTQIQLREVRHPVYPIVTGTFGGVDFLHSVCGEFDDKTTQSEIQELEGTMQQFSNSNGNNSILQDLLSKIPSGVLGGGDQAGKANQLQQNSVNHQMQNARISPRQPEEWAHYLDDVQKQIYPIIQWHDEILQSITETIEKIPILPDLIEQIQDAINKFVFSLLAPYVVPIISQVKNELNTGSNQIIKSSLDKQHIVFKDDTATDPTHSMLSKDHFSNVLNEPAGKDDERIDIDRTLNRIIHGVLHHPALHDYGQDGAGDGRRLMFRVVEEWWRGKSEQEKDTLREQLSRRGVESGKNHKPGVQDHGHGSNRPLGMANLNPNRPASSSSIAGLAGFGGGQNPRPSNTPVDQLGQIAGAAVGGGALGSLVSGVASGLGGNLLGGGLSQNQSTYEHKSYSESGAFTQTITQLGESPSGDRFGQAQFSRTTEPFGGQPHEEYNRFEQRENRGHLQGQVHHEVRTSTTYSEETRRYNDDRPPHGHHPEPHHHPEPEHDRRRHNDEDRDNFLERRSDRGSDFYSPHEPRNDGWRPESEMYGSDNRYDRQTQRPQFPIDAGRGEFEPPHAPDRFRGPRPPHDAPFNSGGDGGPWQQGYPGEGDFGGQREHDQYGVRGPNAAYGGPPESAAYGAPGGREPYGERRESEAFGHRGRSDAYGQGRDDATGGERYGEDDTDGYQRQSQVGFNGDREDEYGAGSMPGGYDRQEAEYSRGSRRGSAFGGQGYGQENDDEDYGRPRFGEAGEEGERYGGYERRY